MAERIRYRDRTDHMITFVLISLIIFGLVMVFSVASSQENMKLFLKQFIAMGVGLAFMYGIHYFTVDYLKHRWIIWLIYAVACGMILALLLPEPYTHKVNGATRWLNLGIQFQVAEFVKIAIVLALAFWIDSWKNRDGLKEELIYIIGGWLIGFVPAGALMKISNDLSSSMVIAGITFIMIFVGSKGKLGWFLHVAAALAVIAFVVWYVMRVANNMPTEEAVINYEIKFRDGRIAAWLDPERYSKSIGFQTLHCLYAIANGGWVGKGLGQSWQKSILPESENDVIFAVIIEELGILGGFLLLFLFGVLLVLMCKVAYNVEEDFHRMIIVGVVSHIMLQVIIHCSVCINLIPNTGIGLPFISSGMTQSLTQLIEMAMVLSITRIHVKELSVKKKKMRHISRDAGLRRKSAEKLANREEDIAQEIPEYGNRRRNPGSSARGRNGAAYSGNRRSGGTSYGINSGSNSNPGRTGNRYGNRTGVNGSRSGASRSSYGSNTGVTGSGYGGRAGAGSYSGYGSRAGAGSYSGYGGRSSASGYAGSRRSGTTGYRSKYPTAAEYRQARYPSSKNREHAGYSSGMNAGKTPSTGSSPMRKNSPGYRSANSKVTPFRPRD